MTRPAPILWSCGVVPGHGHASEADAWDCVRRHTVSAPYGHCPKCGARGHLRRPGGNDRCERGHTYPSSEAK